MIKRRHGPYYTVALFLLIVFGGCQQKPRSHYEAIYRQEDEVFLLPELPQPQPLPSYPWDGTLVGGYPRITADYFRCRGSPTHPPRLHGQTLLRDCHPHGLPMINGEPAISHTLLNILNELQRRTQRRVVITTGHRCPIHNAYSDPSVYNRSSKHLSGAEVDFYIEGFEERPEKIIELVMELYASSEDPSLRNFQRYERENLNVRTLPWYNSEILMKLYHRDEGRDWDNGHPYPYIGIQDRSCGVDRLVVENYHRTM